MRFIACLGLCAMLGGPLAWAESSADVTALRQQIQELTRAVHQLKGTVDTQQQHIADLERASLAQVPPVASKTQAGSPASLLGRQSVGGANLSALNPEIGVVADMLAQRSSHSTEGDGNDKLSVREIELVFGHPIDPYSRFDSTITFSDFENPDIEEAYITHWGLPGEIKAKLGRMRPKIGKASAVHGDVLDTVDEPLVVQRYFGNEGLFRTGLELTGFIPVPWTAVTHELTVGMMEGGVGEGGALFGETRRRPSFYTHLKNFWDISDVSNVELGTTYLIGSKDADAAFEVNALGLDATVTQYITPANKLKWQNEAYLQHRKETVTFGETETTSAPNTPWGFYSLLDYRLSPRFGIGGRFDYVEPVEIDPAILARDADTAWSSYLTFYQSEFARWRLQFRHTDFALGGDDNTIFAQGTVAIGAHKHQLQ